VRAQADHEVVCRSRPARPPGKTKSMTIVRNYISIPTALAFSTTAAFDGIACPLRGDRTDGEDGQTKDARPQVQGWAVELEALCERVTPRLIG
jgi:hypothetical protein